MENSDDLQCLPFYAEQEDMPALRGNLTLRKEVIAGTPFLRGGQYFFKLGPERIKISLLLFRSPILEGVGTNGSEVRESGWCEFQPHSCLRARAVNCFFEVTRIVWSASSWA